MKWWYYFRWGNCCTQVIRAWSFRICLSIGIKKRIRIEGLMSEGKVPVALFYKEIFPGNTCKIDLLVEEEIIIENKSTDGLAPISTFPVITYLKLYKKPLGYLINFNVPLLKEGFKRIVYKF
jgi:GxxExxY protein